MNWHPMSENPPDKNVLFIIQTKDQGYQAAEWWDGCFESFPAGEMTRYIHTPDTVVRWAVVETDAIEPMAESRRAPAESDGGER